ncbi:MAG: hypothetical protein HY863_19030 [Chloroflexi bacterium]|nr:hypothetical protein [Chloroflexota bacterium]
MSGLDCILRGLSPNQSGLFVPARESVTESVDSPPAWTLAYSSKHPFIRYKIR